MKNLLRMILTVASLALTGCGGSGLKTDASPSVGPMGPAAGGDSGSAAGGAGGTGGSGAGGATTGRSCPSTFTPCGGDVTGTWHLKFDECFYSSASSVSFSLCSSETTSMDPSSTFAADYTFAANGEVRLVVSGQLISTVNYPPGCLQGDAGAVQACAELNKAMQAISSQIGDAGVSNIASLVANCSAGSDGTCACHQEATYGAISRTGSYTTSGTKITLSISGGTSGAGGAAGAGADGPVDYCVSGNTLTMAQVNSSGNRSPAVLTRQAFSSPN